jgi:hypothetical protein
MKVHMNYAILQNVKIVIMLMTVLLIIKFAKKMMTQYNTGGYTCVLSISRSTMKSKIFFFK